MSSYDSWKLMSPDDERKTYDCDVCGKATPMRHVKQAWTTTGLEAWACCECRGYDPADYDEDYCPRCAQPALATYGVEYPDCNCPDND